MPGQGGGAATTRIRSGPTSACISSTAIRLQDDPSPGTARHDDPPPLRAEGVAGSEPIIPAVTNRPSPRPLRVYMAAWLGFLAVLSALLAPVSMLADEVRTGKLGGICTVATAATGDQPASGGDGEHQAGSGSHCDWCGSSGVMAALWPVPAHFPSLDHSAPAVAIATVFPASALGLPYSRGPPLVI